jgi:hypothetical protein
VQDLLRRNRDRVLDEIERACAEGGREPGSVELVAVTKSVDPQVALALHALGQADLGESRIDALEKKRELFDERGAAPRWHFVGHVQRNKAARVVRAADVVHSIDTIALLEAIERFATTSARRPGVYLQVKLTEEEAKHGFAPDELLRAVDRAAELDHVDLLGLMTMAPLVEDEERRLAAAREVFEELAELADTLPGLGFVGGRARLSMGMSSDFVPAIAAGADVVRVGSALFEGLDASEASTREGAGGSGREAPG